MGNPWAVYLKPETARRREKIVAVWRAKEAESTPMTHWLRIADNLRNAGFSWGCSCESDSTGRVLFTADAYAPDGRRFTVLAGDRLTAFVELHAAIHRQGETG